MNIYTVKYDFKTTPRKRTKTDLIVIHHQAGQSTTALAIHKMHLDRGWFGIGYNFYIRAGGMIEEGRPMDCVGAHAGTGVNARSIGICLGGNLDVSPPTNEQIDSLIWLIRNHIFKAYGELEITGHKDHMATNCPGRLFPMDKIKEGIKLQESKLMLNGRLVTAPIKNENNRLYVLLNGVGQERHWIEVRALADLLNAKLTWDPATKTAFINIA